jgi:hypothetical protein
VCCFCPRNPFSHGNMQVHSRPGMQLMNLIRMLFGLESLESGGYKARLQRGPGQSADANTNAAQSRARLPSSNPKKIDPGPAAYDHVALCQRVPATTGPVPRVAVATSHFLVRVLRLCCLANSSSGFRRR